MLHKHLFYTHTNARLKKKKDLFLWRIPANGPLLYKPCPVRYRSPSGQSECRSQEGCGDARRAWLLVTLCLCARSCRSLPRLCRWPEPRNLHRGRQSRFRSIWKNIVSFGLFVVYSSWAEIIIHHFSVDVFVFSDARVVKDLATGKSKGYGFISFINKWVRVYCRLEQSLCMYVFCFYALRVYGV